MSDSEAHTLSRLVADAGRLVDHHAIAWQRYLSVPVDRVWQAIATEAEVAEWWIGNGVALDLRPGGFFAHHWVNLVEEVVRGKHIDFGTDHWGTGGMRLEISPLGDGTRFTFIDVFAADAEALTARADSPSGPPMSWWGPCAGWHAMIDGLERHVTGDGPRHDPDVLGAFYKEYLGDVFRWSELVATKREAGVRYNAANPNWWVEASAVERTRPVSHQSSEPEVVELTPQRVLVAEQTGSLEEVVSAAPGLISGVRQVIADSAGNATGPPFLRYVAAGSEVTCQAGFPIDDAVNATDETVITELPGGRAVVAHTKGPDLFATATWPVVVEKAVALDRPPSSPLGVLGGWQEFLNDPRAVGIENAESRVVLPV